ncbi:hypothetical protein P8452_47738 [Trifolium repens]|nr:hypothetical protein P8452_47738 [Trifolium repens]
MMMDLNLWMKNLLFEVMNLSFQVLLNLILEMMNLIFEVIQPWCVVVSFNFFVKENRDQAVVVKEDAQLVINPYGKEAVSRMLLVHLEDCSREAIDLILGYRLKSRKFCHITCRRVYWRL